MHIYKWPCKLWGDVTFFPLQRADFLLIYALSLTKEYLLLDFIVKHSGHHWVVVNNYINKC